MLLSKKQVRKIAQQAVDENKPGLEVGTFDPPKQRPDGFCVAASDIPAMATVSTAAPKQWQPGKGTGVVLQTLTSSSGNLILQQPESGSSETFYNATSRAVNSGVILGWVWRGGHRYIDVEDCGSL